MKNTSLIRDKKIFVVGAGRLGNYLIGQIRHPGLALLGHWNHSKPRAKAIAEITHLAPYFGKFPALVKSADIVFITTKDSFIAETVTALFKLGYLKKNQILLHCSGFISSDILLQSQTRTRKVASMHPCSSFTTEQADIPGEILWGVEGEKEAVAACHELIALFGGTAFTLRPEDKPIYHAAAVFLTNFINAICHVSADILKDIIPNETLVQGIINSYTSTTLKNIQQEGPVDALSGPLLRGEAAIITAHLKKLKATPYHPLYKELSRVILRMLKQRQLYEKGHEKIQEILEGD